MNRETIEAEAERIRARLVNHPHPYEHGLLYAAQQALAWVLNPAVAASPLDAVLEFQEARTGCHRNARQELFEDTGGAALNG